MKCIFWGLCPPGPPSSIHPSIHSAIHSSIHLYIRLPWWLDLFPGFLMALPPHTISLQLQIDFDMCGESASEPSSFSLTDGWRTNGGQTCVCLLNKWMLAQLTYWSEWPEFLQFILQILYFNWAQANPLSVFVQKKFRRNVSSVSTQIKWPTICWT